MLSAFVTKWKTTYSDEPIYIRAKPDYDYDFTVDWGDGTVETINELPDNYKFVHKYAGPGTHTVTIWGKFPHCSFSGDNLVGMEQWGNIAWLDLSGMFYDCQKMKYNATDVPDLSNVTDMSSMFRLAKSFNGDISGWDTSNVTNMSHMFQGLDEHKRGKAMAFNGDISGWDTSNVTNMNFMFRWATSFNRDLSNWDTSKVTGMAAMFEEASSFNGDISGWDTSNVTNMSAMFSGARSFNGDLSNWDTSNVTHMNFMFEWAHSFNGDISGWDTSNVIGMMHMFLRARSFNGDLSNWDTSNVTKMSYMFEGASSFNGDISGWDIGNVTDMSYIFNNSGMSSANLGNTLIGWCNYVRQNGKPLQLTIGVDNLSICIGEGQNALQNLIDNYGWGYKGNLNIVECN